MGEQVVHCFLDGGNAFQCDAGRHVSHFEMSQLVERGADATHARAQGVVGSPARGRCGDRRVNRMRGMIGTGLPRQPGETA
jgi:hypothetical protein